MSRIECVHSYLIETPNGRDSVGVCEKCGHSKEMINVLPLDMDHLSWKETKEYLWLHRSDKDEYYRYSG